MTCIFDIKRYSIHDGPGIRTTVFIKGCPLRCVWCHNPESWLSIPQRLYKRHKCIGCKECVNVCSQQALSFTENGMVSDLGKCTICGKCAEVCPALAMEVCGKVWSMEDLLAEIEKERGIMEQSKGGITVSGGEPLMHPDFTLALLREVDKRGLHRTVDTTLYTSSEVVKAVSEECELFLIDLKSMDSGIHKKFTGVPNEKILRNLRLIASNNHPYYIRIPLIEGVNASDENLEATIKFLNLLDRKPDFVDLLPYHDIGIGKHERMGSIYNPEKFLFETPSQEKTDRFLRKLKSAGLNGRIGG